MCAAVKSFSTQNYGMGRNNATQKLELAVIRGTLNAQRYIQNVLEPVAIPFINHEPCKVLN